MLSAGDGRASSSATGAGVMVVVMGGCVGVIAGEEGVSSVVTAKLED